MTRRKLWIVIGAVVSLIWMVAAAVYQRNADVEGAERFAKFSFKVCVDNRANKVAQCEQERENHLKTFMQGSWGNVAFLSLAPIPFAWLAAVVLFTLARVQIAGFRAVLPW